MKKVPTTNSSKLIKFIDECGHVALLDREHYQKLIDHVECSTSINEVEVHENCIRFLSTLSSWETPFRLSRAQVLLFLFLNFNLFDESVTFRDNISAQRFSRNVIPHKNQQ